MEEREMIKVRKQKYGELVRENYKPPVSERKKSERIANIISPRQLMGKGQAHSDPRFWQDSNSGMAVPKSLLTD